jgi:two-component system, NtrC family, sensor histidine kinase HydH
MGEQLRATFAWMDLLWLAFLAGLAVLEPIREPHKQMILAAIGAVQVFERRLLAGIGFARGRNYMVLIKVGLATLLVAHTAEVPINSSYYLIYFLPVITAAMYFGALATLAWTALACAAYGSFLILALQVYDLTPDAASELILRNLFFFLTAIVVNRFVAENRRQARALEETNRRLEQAEAEARRSERLAALGQLSAGLAHELRNPLGIIKGSAETLSLRVQSADPVTAEVAGYISGEVDRMNTLVSRFLDFARPLALETRLEPVPPIVDRSLQAVHARWPNAAVEVERHYAPDLPLVPVDADLCEQVFSNLALNAYEAMGEKGGWLRVSIAPAVRNGQRGVEVRFEDSGPGISPELREQIFNPFFTTKKSGVGLGLSIVAKIVDDHHGAISVTSSADGGGPGACFRLFFPAGESRA